MMNQDERYMVNKANQVMEMLELLIRNKKDYCLIGDYVSLLLLKIQSQSRHGK